MRTFPNWRGEVPASVADGTNAELPGKAGRIVVYDDETLTVTVANEHAYPKDRVHRLMSLPGSVLFVRGDTEAVVHVRREYADVAAEVIGASRRRRVSPEERERLRRVGAGTRIKKKDAALSGSGGG